MNTGLLAVGFDFNKAHHDEFHDWYDLEHLPERQAVAGFGACERWLALEQATSALATYDRDDISVLRSAGYGAIAYDNLSPWSKRVTAMCTRLLRFEGLQLSPGSAAAPSGAGALLINAMNVVAGGEDEFNAWYDEEHLPALRSVAGTLSARRYKADANGKSTHQYLAMYHLRDAQVVSSAPWSEAVDTPWSARMRPLFRDRLRVLNTRYDRATSRLA